MRLSLNDALHGYLESLRARGKKTTVAVGESHAANIIRVLPADAYANDLRIGSLDNYVRIRLEKGLARATVNSELRTLRAALRHAGIKHVEVKMLKEHRKAASVLTELEVRALFDECRNNGWRSALAAARLALFAGLRKGEIQHLRDEDLHADFIRVCGHGNWTPKNWQDRCVPRHRNIQDGDATRARELNPTIIPSTLRDQGVVADRKPGLHMLRRTWATNLLRVTDLETVRQLGGWADISTVQRYLGSDNKQKREAIDAL